MFTKPRFLSSGLKAALEYLLQISGTCSYYLGLKALRHRFLSSGMKVAKCSDPFGTAGGAKPVKSIIRIILRNEASGNPTQLAALKAAAGFRCSAHPAGPTELRFLDLGCGDPWYWLLGGWLVGWLVDWLVVVGCWLLFFRLSVGWLMGW